MVNFTAQTIQQQIAKQSGQIAITSNGGSLQYTNTATGAVLNLPPATSALLNNPIKSNNPKLSATALAAAQGFSQQSATYGRPDDALRHRRLARGRWWQSAQWLY